MRRVFFFVFLLVTSGTLWAQSPDSNIFRSDFDYFWKIIQSNYAYLPSKKIDWDKAQIRYGAIFSNIKSKRQFILELEKVLNELYDHHASLNTNTSVSQRMIPSGTDIWAEFINGKPVIVDIRRGFGSFNTGMKSGMTVVSINDKKVDSAIHEYLPQTLTSSSLEAKNYALRLALAGRHSDDRKILLRSGTNNLLFYPDRPDSLLKTHRYNGDIETKTFSGNIGYIKINDRLWDNNIIPLFDSVLKKLSSTKALILDLRETASGGNTTVARAILGSFITREGYYQTHELTGEERKFGVKRSWSEIVSPRSNPYQGPLVVLVNHWTGSVGEGIAIGFDALKRGVIIGTKMAGLSGAVYTYELPQTKIKFSIPAEKLFHINGKPRENFLPTILVDMRTERPGEDKILATALNYLKKRGEIQARK